MTSRLRPRVSGNVAPGPAPRDAEMLRRVRARQLEISRSASTVARSAALSAAQELNEALVAVIVKGYVADSQLGTGLAKPLLAMPTQPVAATPTFAICGPNGWEQDTNSATFETLFQHVGVRQNVCWAPAVSVTCSDGTTAGQLRFVDLDTGLALQEALAPVSVYAVAAGSTDVDLAPAAPGLLLPQEYGTPIRLGVQARVTAGAGSITVAVTQSIGG